MLFRNKELDRAFEFITNSDFDIFCLQEVPKEFLERLHTLPCYVAYAIDKERLYPNATVFDYVVTLSKHPIEKQSTFSFPNYMSELKLRTRFFMRMMRYFHFTKLGERNGQYTDIVVPGFPKPIRVFNVHLILGNPHWRLREFETALVHADPSRLSVVCGDFNIVESRFTATLNWWLGGKVSDMLFHRRERTHIEEHFMSYELINPLRGKITHPFSRSQLDHILVSNSLSVVHAYVLSDSVGSDHHPIVLEINK